MGRNWCGNLCRKKKLEAFVYRELHVNCYWEKAAQPTSAVAQAAAERGRRLTTEASKAIRLGHTGAILRAVFLRRTLTTSIYLKGRGHIVEGSENHTL